MSEQLKPCPFCGGSVDTHSRGNEHTASRATIIKCRECNVEMTVGAIRNTLEWTQGKAIAAWNRRAPVTDGTESPTIKGQAPMTRPKYGAKPRMSEAALHKAVAAYLRVALKPPTIWTTIGHGGGGKIRGAQLKAMGVQKGWPDILVMTPNGKKGDTLVVGLELKAERGRMTPEQTALRDAFMATWAWYFKATSVDQVETFLLAAGVPLHLRLS